MGELLANGESCDIDDGDVRLTNQANTVATFGCVGCDERRMALDTEWRCTDHVNAITMFECVRGELMNGERRLTANEYERIM